MENLRIRKLLFAEYKELAGEKILVESPFAETTRNGRGIREVALALTRTKLLVASDVFRHNRLFWCLPEIDPSIETLELISIYPLEFINLSVFRRRRSQVLKARFCDGRVKYFELGGLANRARSWRRWRDHVDRLVERRCLNSSMSETTAAGSSTCASTCYLLSSREYEYDSGASGRCVRNQTRLFAGGDGPAPTWTQKDLYLGPGYYELTNGTYKARPIRFADASLQEIQDELDDYSPRKKSSCSSSKSSIRHHGKNYEKQCGKVSNVIYARKNDGKSMEQRPFVRAVMKESLEDQKRDVQEMLDFKSNISNECPSVVLEIEEPGSDTFRNGCCTSDRRPSKIPRMINKSKVTPKLKAKPQTRKIVRRLSRFGFGVDEKCNPGLCLGSLYKNDPNLVINLPVNFHKLVESGVAVWENSSKCNKGKEESTKKHLRRYGLSTATYFLNALGPWSVQPGDRESCQARLRSNSCVTIRRQPVDPELRLPVSRRQLATGISLPDLSSCNGQTTASTTGRVVLFWTPDYWYRPRAATDAYREIRRHLGKLSQFRAEMEEEPKIARRIAHVFGKRRADYHEATVSGPSRRILTRIFSNQKISRPNRANNASGTSHLRNLLRLEFRVTLWDLDSTTLSHQLTLIDRELFLRIPWRRELAILAKQRASRDTPNLGAWIAFAHRVACLMASEILAASKVDMRARLIARLVNAAERCFHIGNFHSARSIVAGLQSPAVYRLHETWSHLRTRHATRYETMEKLCKLFKSTRTKRYRRIWSKAEATPPSMPFVGDVLSQLLAALAVKPRNTASKAPAVVGVAKASTAERPRKPPATGQKRGLRKWIRSIKFRPPPPLGAEELDWTDRERDLARRYCDRWRARVERRRRLRAAADRPLDKLVDWLECCQRQARRGYDYCGHSLAWEFLLKARYREDRDNFFASLQLEPPDFGF